MFDCSVVSYISSTVQNVSFVTTLLHFIGEQHILEERIIDLELLLEKLSLDDITSGSRSRGLKRGSRLVSCKPEIFSTINLNEVSFGPESYFMNNKNNVSTSSKCERSSRHMKRYLQLYYDQEHKCGERDSRASSSDVSTESCFSFQPEVGSQLNENEDSNFRTKFHNATHKFNNEYLHKQDACKRSNSKIKNDLNWNHGKDIQQLDCLENSVNFENSFFFPTTSVPLSEREAISSFNTKGNRSPQYIKKQTSPFKLHKLISGSTKLKKKLVQKYKSDGSFSNKEKPKKFQITNSRNRIKEKFSEIKSNVRARTITFQEKHNVVGNITKYLDIKHLSSFTEPDDVFINNAHSDRSHLEADGDECKYVESCNSNTFDISWTFTETSARASFLSKIAKFESLQKSRHSESNVFQKEIAVLRKKHDSGTLKATRRWSSFTSSSICK